MKHYGPNFGGVPGLPTRIGYRRAYDPAALLLFASFSGQPNAARKDLISDTITRLRHADLWRKIEYLQVYAAHDTNAALKNWKNPGTGDATLVNAPTFAADRGYTTDGSTNYVETNFNFSTATLYTQNSAHWGVWSRTVGQQTNATGWFDGTDGVNINPRSASDTSSHRVNQASATTAASTDGTGLFIVDRSTSSAHLLSRNGVSIASGVVTSTARNNATPSLGRLTAIAFCAREWSMSFGGLHLTGPEHALLYNILNRYMVAVGAV